jgi:Fe-S-cluster containining protein
MLGIVDYTNKGKCSNCGECCSNFLPLTDDDIQRIREYIKEHDIKAVNRTYPFAEKTIDGRCPFRSDTERKCLIYEVRPAICKVFKCDKPIMDKKTATKFFKNNKTFKTKAVRETFYGKETE